MGKVFCIGLNKTGTSSLHEALRLLGLSSLHHGGREAWSAVDRARNEGAALLSYLGEDYDAYLDVGPLTGEFMLADRQYPDSRFILTVRDIGSWIDSRRRHVARNIQQARRDEYQGDWLTVDPDAWVHEWYQHYGKVMWYFRRRPADLLVLDICGGDGWDLLAPFLGRRQPGVAFPHENHVEGGVQAAGPQPGAAAARGRARSRPLAPFPPHMSLTVTSRHPTTLTHTTSKAVLDKPMATLVNLPGDRAPRASVVVVTFDNLVFNRLCLESLLSNTEQPELLEVIIVDNGSRDGTPAYLEVLERAYPQVRVVWNDLNVGFAGAANRGLALAEGEMLFLLNNDTIVPPGWLHRLGHHLEDPSVGIVGPVTNAAGNEARIKVPYETYGGLVDFAGQRARAYAKQWRDMPMLTMFCMGMRRPVFEGVGPLDERFEVGMFEDDDYSLRVRSAGLRVLCAEDAFVHHFGEASLGKLVPTGEYSRIFDANRRRFEEKWELAWKPHGHRATAEYLRSSIRLRELMKATLPPDAGVLVISKGDESLLDVDGRRTMHFPQDDDGRFAGCYPADSAEAVGHLEALRKAGARYLVVPSAAHWWLDHYPEFGRHLQDRYAVVVEEDAGMIFEAVQQP